jgi:hypothetical protein
VGFHRDFDRAEGAWLMPFVKFDIHSAKRIPPFKFLHKAVEIYLVNLYNKLQHTRPEFGPDGNLSANALFHT